jgi:hypothetical protein
MCSNFARNKFLDRVERSIFLSCLLLLKAMESILDKDKVNDHRPEGESDNKELIVWCRDAKEGSRYICLDNIKNENKSNA